MVDAYADNLAFLRQEIPALPELLGRAAGETPPAVEASRAGPPTTRAARADGALVWLHSRVDPEREARRWGEAIERTPLATYVLLGVGLGYPLAELLARVPPGTPVVAIERSAALARESMARRDWRSAAAGRRLFFLPGVRPEDVYPLLRPHIDALLCGPVILVEHPPSAAAFAAEYGALRAAVTAWVRSASMMIQTTMALGRRLTVNRFANLPAYVRSCGIAPYRELAAGCPVIVASAGPSLQRNLPLLREAQGRALVIAVSTALRVLLENGVRPDFTAVIDYHEVSRRYFEELPPGPPIPIIASACAAPAAIGAHRGPPLFYEDDLLPLFLPSQRGRHGALGHSGSTVAHVAASFALFLGASRVILVGQDLSYPHGVTHVPGTAIHAEWLPQTGRFRTLETMEWESLMGQRERLVRITDVGGRPIFTDHAMLLYLKEFEFLCGSNPGRFVNATEGGAAMHGAEHLPLSAALERYGAPRPDARLAAAGASPRLPLDDPTARELREVDVLLGRLADGMDRLGDVLRRLQTTARDGGDPSAGLAAVQEAERRLLPDRVLELALDTLDRTGDYLRDRADREISAKEWSPESLRGAQLERDLMVVGSRLEAIGTLRDLLRSTLAGLEGGARP